MNKLSLFLALACTTCANVAYAQVDVNPTPFPLSGAFIWSPKARTTIAALTYDIGKTQPITLGKHIITPTLFSYAGLDTSANGAGGFGAKLTKDLGGIAVDFGGTYGVIRGDKPHAGLLIGFTFKLAH